MELELRDFVLGGVGLEGEAKERFNAIQQQLAQLSTKFSNNVLDATKVGPGWGGVGWGMVGWGRVVRGGVP